VTVIAEQPAKWIVELERYFGAGSVTRDGEGLVAIPAPAHPHLTRTGYAQRYPA